MKPIPPRGYRLLKDNERISHGDYVLVEVGVFDTHRLEPACGWIGLISKPDVGDRMAFRKITNETNSP